MFYFNCFVVAIWILTSGGSVAQKTTHLKLNPDKLQYAREVEQKAIKNNDSLLLAEAWYLYGKLYVIAGDYQKAQAYFMKALRVQDERGDSEELSRLYSRLSENEATLGHLDESLRFAHRALEIAQHIRSDIALIRSYGTLGQLYERKWSNQLVVNREKYKRVLTYYQHAESLCYKTKDSMGVAEMSVQLGQFLTKTKNLQAIPYLKKAIYLFSLKNKWGNKINAMIYLVSAYLMADQMDQAFQTLFNAETLYRNKQLDDYNILAGIETHYVLCYQATNQWRAAFEHLKRLNTLEKGQLLADNGGAISRLHIEYETQKKETLLNVQKNELALRAENFRTQQQFIWAVSALLMVSIGMSIVFFRLYRKKQKISYRNEELVKEQNHRVKNNLQVVSSLLSLQAKRLTDEAAKNAVEESRLRVQSMAIIHRKLYDGDRLAMVNLDEFIQELVSGVLKSFGYPFATVQYAINNCSLSADKAIPLGLILNELITNACKYAFPQNENPHLTVRCYAQHAKLYLQVTDNGPGLEVPVIQTDDLYDPQTKSFGMSLIQAQVMQLNGTYQFGSADKTESTGTTFTMEFKL